MPLKTFQFVVTKEIVGAKHRVERQRILGIEARVMNINQRRSKMKIERVLKELKDTKQFRFFDERNLHVQFGNVSIPWRAFTCDGWMFDVECHDERVKKAVKAVHKVLTKNKKTKKRK